MAKKQKKTVLHIKVTKKDIIEGQGGDTNFCAIALATKRAVTEKLGIEDPDVSVDGATIEINGEEQISDAVKCVVEANITTPAKAAKFISKFDSAKEDYFDEAEGEYHTPTDAEVLKKVKPFEFTVTV